MAFENVNIIGSRWIHENGCKILDVEEFHALIMAAGYLKLNLHEGIYFRGQSSMLGLTALILT